MLEKEYIELFFSKSYENDIDKLIRDDKYFVIPYEQLMSYVNRIISISYREFITYICSHPLIQKIETKDITQSSSFSACEIKMCDALLSVNNPGLSFLEIGKLFPEYISHPNDTAYRKYGENQIRTSSHLGLVYEYYNFWYLSCLGYIYPRLSEDDRTKLLARTILRVPFYYRVMVDLYYNDIGLAKYMQSLSRATQRRREGSVCRLLDICLDECSREGISMHHVIRDSIGNLFPVNYTLPSSDFDMAAEMLEEYNTVAYDENNHIEGQNEKINKLYKLTVPLEVPQDFNLDHFLEENSSASFRRYLLQLSKYRVYSNEEILELLSRYRDGDRKAYELIVKSHQRLVTSIAYNYVKDDISIEDLIQEGNLGLIRAIELFDKSQGVSFTNYAKTWIFQAVYSSLLYLPYLVKIPSNNIALYQRIQIYKEQYEQLNEFPPSIDDIILDMSLDNQLYIKRAKILSQLPQDLTDMVCFCDDFDCIESDFPQPDYFGEQEYFRFWVDLLTGLLRKKDSFIVRAYYGIDSKIESINEMARQFELSRERIRQIVEESKEKMRNPQKLLKEAQERRKRTVLNSQEAHNPYVHFLSEKKIKKNVTDAEKIIRETKKILSLKRQKQYDAPLRGGVKYEEVMRIMSRYKLYVSINEIVNAIDKSVWPGDISSDEIKRILHCLPSVKYVKWCDRYSLKDQWESDRNITTSLNQNNVNKKIARQPVVKKNVVKISSIENNSSNYYKYTKFIKNIRQAYVRGEVIIAKPVLLIAIIDGIEAQVFDDNRFVLNDWLEEQYNSLMKQYTKNSQFGNTTTIEKPFWHLESDGFWHLKCVARKPKSHTPSKTWLKENIECAYFDESLWILLKSKTWRTRLRDYIINNKLA